jgi:hypothetical protein
MLRAIEPRAAAGQLDGTRALARAPRQKGEGAAHGYEPVGILGEGGDLRHPYPIGKHRGQGGLRPCDRSVIAAHEERPQ